MRKLMSMIAFGIFMREQLKERKLLALYLWFNDFKTEPRIEKRTQHDHDWIKCLEMKWKSRHQLRRSQGIIFSRETKTTSVVNFFFYKVLIKCLRVKCVCAFVLFSKSPSLFYCLRLFINVEFTRQLQCTKFVAIGNSNHMLFAQSYFTVCSVSLG